MAEPALQPAPAAQQPVISVRDLGVQFSLGRRNQGLRELILRPARAKEFKPRTFWGLKDVSFDVQPGEAIGVVGRNGGGKSTLLKMVAGVMIPDEGSVAVTGTVAPLIELTGGFVDDLTGRENIYLAAGLHGMPKEEIDAKFDEIVDFAEVREFLDTPFRHYSSGMKVRIAFAVVSQLNGSILLVDEVLAVGDNAFREKCYRRIAQLIEEGRTLFLVSHNDRDLRRFCTRALYLRGGRLIEDGPLDAILERYQKEG